jgi:hypothetical protein
MANELVARWLVLAAASQPSEFKPSGEVCGVVFLKSVSCQSTSLTPTHVALLWVAVPLCKSGAGIHGFFRPVREDLVFFPKKLNLLLNH